jgi:predicted GNAT superfamily acetyltransferase
MDIVIKLGTITDVIKLYEQIPEFKNPHTAAEYEKRLGQAPQSLILLACKDEQVLGFKVGYEREADGSFYSWMGGVSEAYRRYGIAKQLADYQEDWARKQGYNCIRFKTRNAHLPMLLFGLKNGFKIIACEKRENIDENRILLEKKL